jgi:hypothetical protein
MSWAVEVRSDGEVVVTIEDRCLSGRDITEADADLIRDCAQQLLAFVGPKRAQVCECPGWWITNTQQPYPSGICETCGRWYPGRKGEAAPPAETP